MIEAVTADPAFAKSIRVLPLQPLLEGLVGQNILREPLREAVRGSFLRTLPGVHPMDGFFAALLERTA